MEGPGSGRVPTARPKAKAPTSVSDRNAAGLLVQNIKGTAMMPAATAALAHRAQPMRQERERPENSMSAAPSTISEQNSAGSLTCTITGCTRIQQPSAMLTKCAQRHSPWTVRSQVS